MRIILLERQKQPAVLSYTIFVTCDRTFIKNNFVSLFVTIKRKKQGKKGERERKRKTVSVRLRHE